MCAIALQSRLHQNCSELVRPENDTHDPNDTTWCSWSPFGKNWVHGCSLLPSSSWRKKGTPVGSATQPTFCLSHLLSDKDDYTELLGAVDNAFLVAYAIGMFIR